MMVEFFSAEIELSVWGQEKENGSTIALFPILFNHSAPGGGGGGWLLIAQGFYTKTM
jgi:hypothetical protein